MSITDNTTTLLQLKQATAKFARERDWEQFHAPKNLTMAIAAEAAELMEPFLWVSATDSSLLCAKPEKKAKIEEELADVLIFAFQFANMTGIDIAAAIEAKIAKNAAKYPVAKAKGRSEKYTDRYDVLLRRSGEALIIEGKIGPTQNIGQLLRYVRRLHAKYRCKPALTVVDDGSEFLQSRQRAFETVRHQVSRLKFVTWSEVAKTCREIARRKTNYSHDQVGTVIAHELAVHLKENNMTTDPQPEIYLRDVSSIDSVQLYFRHHIYKCRENFYNSAHRNLYFAPYFTRHTADKLSQDNLVPVGEGISFVSRIKSVRVIATKEVQEYLKSEKHPVPREAADNVRRQMRGERNVLIMLLGEPRLMFVSPITKEKLSRLDLDLRFTKGAMGSRTCTFDDLLAASQA